MFRPGQLTGFGPRFRFNQQPVRLKSLLHKKNKARSAPIKTPTMLALEHFDFYYGPIFGKSWPSIRLGLLSPHKYIAAMNNFSSKAERNIQLIEKLGAFELLDTLREQQRRQKNRRSDLGSQSGAIELDLVKAESGENLDALRERAENVEFLKQTAMRGEAGLGEFMPPVKELTREQLVMGRDHFSLKRDSLSVDLDSISGFEGVGFDIPKVDDRISYPERLKLMIYPRSNINDFPSPSYGLRGEPSWYLMDGASIVPILALDLQEGETFFDMCAAPGGKSLLAIQTGLPRQVVCNDKKMARLGQLRRALIMFLPEDQGDWADRIVLKQKDATNVKGWDELQCYDKVLADVPCSSDRLSLIQDEGNMFRTSAMRERLDLPHKQTKILVNALRSARIGGTVVYSTCTLSPVQNEGVVENAAAIAREHFGIKVEERKLDTMVGDLLRSELFQINRQRKFGTLIVPHLPCNFGPMYVCKLRRLA
uniref:NOL1/NOP2/Sun domain family member 4 n=1 Tax=Plectus sambesii TaxID=2011161 RepID=A0A914XUV4_9BILA